MSRNLLITVGTSLFHSVTWKYEGPVEAVPGYDTWVSSPDFLEQPRLRDTEGAATRLYLEELVTGDNAPQWTDCLPEELTSRELRPMKALRYCAELTTLVRMAESKGKSLPEFLEGFERILIPWDPCRTHNEDLQLSSVAAIHLAEYLSRLGGEGRVEKIPVPHLSNPSYGELKDSIDGLTAAALKGFEGGSSLDAVVTGGFKLYGFLLAPLLGLESAPITLHYLHEHGRSGVVSLKHDSVRVYDGSLWEAKPSLLFQLGLED